MILIDVAGDAKECCWKSYCEWDHMVCGGHRNVLLLLAVIKGACGRCGVRLCRENILMIT